ncbi:hypothetical protein CQA53_00995 [Helicobacter didelphidarum]|uniref:Uncharacterized protein n=1 Tax=Helicobacter didelphidarum TaxID=2040648 RepID=A0A3D8ISK7_9HELI|nr:hypothetical protein [Helicobacter didelphidarum]RDU67614.1 hypothetical protein CQA53_00995 [Helicobacter didelphidarum]
MKKWGILLILSIGVLWLIWLQFFQHSIDLETYENFDENNNLISSTEYIPDSHNKSTFLICKTRKGKEPCKEVHGIKNGIEKWYKNGILKYEDSYSHGILQFSTLFYTNGLKHQENIYEAGKLIKQKIYAKDSINSLMQENIYKNQEKISKFFKNNKLFKVEKYNNDILVSRRIYNENGVIIQLEEYGLSKGNGFDPFEYFLDDFDNFERNSPFLYDNHKQNDSQRQQITPDIRSGNWI